MALVVVAVLPALGWSAPSADVADPATVMQTIRLRVPALSACTMKGRQPRGELVAAFTVNAAGVVEELKLSGSTFADPQVAACVKKQIAAWSFATLPGPADFELPLRFTQTGIELGERADAPRLDRPAKKSLAQPSERTSLRTNDGGGLNAERIARVMRAHASEVQACYDEGVARKPGLVGTVSIGLRIMPSGQVASAIVKASTLRDDLVDQCVAQKARQFIFPATSGFTNVDFPYLFRGG